VNLPTLRLHGLFLSALGFQAKFWAPAGWLLGLCGLLVVQAVAEETLFDFDRGFEGEYLDGDIAEIRVYDRLLSRPEQQANLACPGERWGLEGLGGFRSPDGPWLTSPPFTIERPSLRFLSGGGKYPGQTRLNLLVDGWVVRTATGPNDRPGGSEPRDWQQWDVAEFAGQAATLQIVDQATEGWDHLNVDHIPLK